MWPGLRSATPCLTLKTCSGTMSWSARPCSSGKTSSTAMAISVRCSFSSCRRSPSPPGPAMLRQQRRGWDERPAPMLPFNTARLPKAGKSSGSHSATHFCTMRNLSSHLWPCQLSLQHHSRACSRAADPRGRGEAALHPSCYLLLGATGTIPPHRPPQERGVSQGAGTGSPRFLRPCGRPGVVPKFLDFPQHLLLSSRNLAAHGK